MRGKNLKRYPDPVQNCLDPQHWYKRKVDYRAAPEIAAAEAGTCYVSIVSTDACNTIGQIIMISNQNLQIYLHL